MWAGDPVGHSGRTEQGRCSRACLVVGRAGVRGGTGMKAGLAEGGAHRVALGIREEQSTQCTADPMEALARCWERPQLGRA